MHCQGYIRREKGREEKKQRGKKRIIIIINFQNFIEVNEEFECDSLCHICR
jgi:hypothetical protein